MTFNPQSCGPVNHSLITVDTNLSDFVVTTSDTVYKLDPSVTAMASVTGTVAMNLRVMNANIVTKEYKFDAFITDCIVTSPRPTFDHYYLINGQP